MKLGVHAENALERAMLALGLIPTPFIETHGAMLLARAVAAASRLGAFDALEHEALSAEEVARRCGTAPAPTNKLLDALVGGRYLRRRAGTYTLRPRARRWLLASAPRSMRDQLEWQRTEWEWVGELDRYVADGQPVDMHARMNAGEWDAYQRGMRSVARILAPEVAWRTPVPRNARTLLDIGGSHGFFAVALCRRHPRLRAVVLDLPAAIEASAGLLAEEGMGERVTHRPGDVLHEDLGVEAWDVVLMSQLAHHFDEGTNRRLAARVARALKPGGVFVLQDVLRPESGATRGQLGSLYDLYFSLTSASGTWSAAEMAGWQRDARLRPARAAHFVSAPGMGQQPAWNDGARAA